MQMNRTPEHLVKLGEQRTAMLKAADLPQVISTKQAANLLGCSCEKVMNLCRENEIESHMQNGSHKVMKDSVLAYAREHFGERTGLFDNCILGEKREISFSEIPREVTIRRVGRVFE